MIQSLRKGHADTARTFLALGTGPMQSMHLVSDDGVDMARGTGQVVDLHTLWFWSHQAESDGAVGVWWERMDQELESKLPRARGEQLKEIWIQACQAGMGWGAPLPLMLSWEKCAAWFDKDSRWSHDLMSKLFVDTAISVGNPAAPVLLAANAQGWLGQRDWLPERVGRYERAPVATAVERSQVELLTALLDTGAAEGAAAGALGEIRSLAWDQVLSGLRQPGPGQSEILEAALDVVDVLQKRSLGLPASAKQKDALMAELSVVDSATTSSDIARLRQLLLSETLDIPQATTGRRKRM